MSTQTQDRLDINEVVHQIELAPQSQKLQAAFNGVAKQMQQTDNSQTQQFGAQLQQGTPQIVKACQQG